MQLQFREESLPCMQQVLEEIQDQELTQDIRLTEGMPDVGTVISAWGQVLIRGKQWQADRVGVTGGVQVWVLYAPEDGEQPRTVEAWLPFQFHWDLPGDQPDGSLWVMPLLRQVDARSVSDQKLLIRATVSVLCKAMVPGKIATFQPGEIPEDVQLKIRKDAVLIPTEMGEKSFVLDEELSVPNDQPKPEKILRVSLNPRISEGKVMAGKLVFRGDSDLHMLYRAQEKLYTLDLEIPFAQYGELDQEYDPDANLWIYPVVTSLETDLGENGGIRLKAGITAQYMVWDQQQLPVVEDAYSTLRECKLHGADMDIPVMTGQKQWEIPAACPWNGEGTVVDRAFYGDHPRYDGTGRQMTGRFQVLYYDPEGTLRSVSYKWEHEESVITPMYLCGTQSVTDQGTQLQMLAMENAPRQMQTLSAISLGDTVEKDPNRPSLVLRRVGADSLWELAKSTGSTVEAIEKANSLTGMPSPGDFVMIPIA